MPTIPTSAHAPTNLTALPSPLFEPSGLTAIASPATGPVSLGNIVSPQGSMAGLTTLASPSGTVSLTSMTPPGAAEAPTSLRFEKLVMFEDILDQIASMLGADEWEDLPTIDQQRVKIMVNQAYRECYAPIDGARPRWASKKMTLRFSEDQQSYPLDKGVIDVEKVPELVGHGPLSPMNARTDEMTTRTHYSGDFRPIGAYRGRFPSINADEPEKDRPIWYFVDQTDEGSDTMLVIPRLVLYPIPDKEYEVKLVANIMPDLLDVGDSPRLPGDAIWDILFPLAQYKLLTDPRYNGDNREIIVMAAKEAKRKLKHFSSPQKHKTLRLVRRVGW